MISKKILCSVTVAALAYFWIKYVKQGPIYRSNASLKGKTVLITGGNAGIGKATAIELAKTGARIVIASRNTKKSDLTKEEILRETGNNNIRCMHVDLLDLNSVRLFAKEFDETEEYLDFLINNAGVMAQFGKTDLGINKIFAVNHLGPFLLTNLLLNKMKKQSETRPVRIINLAAQSYKWANITEESMYEDVVTMDDMFKTASNSKLANVYFTIELNKRLKDFHITTYAIHPGMIASDMMEPLPQYIKLPLRIPVFMITRSPYYGCQTILYCALDEEVTVLSGNYFNDCAYEELDPSASNENIGKYLWEESVKLCDFSGS